MPARRDPSERIYRWILRAYPARFRAEFGDEMARLFRDQRREVGGRPALMRLWLDTLADAAASLPDQHADALSRRLRRLAERTAPPNLPLQHFPQEIPMRPKTLAGAALLLLAAGNIAYDALSINSMGVAAILLTTVAAAVGAVLVWGRHPLPERS